MGDGECSLECESSGCLSPPHFPVCVWLFFLFFSLFFFSWQLKICACLMKALASPVAESGVQQGSNHFLCQGWCLYLYVCRCGNKKKKEDEVYFAFVIFWPRFVFFCCKLVSVIDPVASLTHLAFGCPTCLGLCFLVQRVLFFFVFVFFGHL